MDLFIILVYVGGGFASPKDCGLFRTVFWPVYLGRALFLWQWERTK